MNSLQSPNVKHIEAEKSAPPPSNVSGAAPMDERETDNSDLRNRIEALERSLDHEARARGVLERELNEIKNSLAWMVVARLRAFRNKFLPQQSKYGRSYEIVRDFFKAVALNPGQMRPLAVKSLRILRHYGSRELQHQLRKQLDGDSVENEYRAWVEKYAALTDADRDSIKRHLERLRYQPLVSLIMPTYNSPEKWLRLAIESVRDQLYRNWELCIAEDGSSEPHVRRILEEYRAKDSRIKIVFLDQNSHISAASNAAIDMAAGEFLAFLDHDDLLSEHALYMIIVELNRFPQADLIYSDEDKIDEEGRRYDAYFKPDWNPALFLAQNFICHLMACRTAVVRELQGFREGYEGAQDWDLAMRMIERIPEAHIRHIPHVLYHWRAIAGSAAYGMDEKNYVRSAQRRTLESHFDRIGTRATVVPTAGIYWRVKYPLSVRPLVTLIIPTRNRLKLLKICVDGIFQKTTYCPVEILIIDNQSDDPATLSYLATLAAERRARILRFDAPFNYAAINNLAVKHARGEIIGLLNNDIDVITPDWLEEMVSHAMRPETGAVGALLYYPNNTIQHAGVILGLGGTPGVAGHAYQERAPRYSGQAARASLCQNFSAVTAACLVIRRQIYEEVGGMDETNLAVSFNDVDFCLRLQEKGYKNLLTPYAELYHNESASRGYEETPENRARFAKECDYMHHRWEKLLENDPAYNPNLALDRPAFMLAFPPRTEKPWLINSD